RICVCADLESRLARCMKYENKKPESERLTEKQVLKNIRRIDKGRARTREILTGKARGDGSTFDLTINAANWEMKKLVPATAEFARQWFEQ
ncbi:MAG: cytidylate kinase-like family protein, partial [Oscillospiraceae bacterium]|nr:cytidylate kinase-like family protein [Oscillospiraceae bacterium]